MLESMPPRPKKVPRVAAIDLGKARAGIAVVDELGLMAHSRGFLDAQSRKPLLAALKELAAEEKLERFLVGLPLEMTGEAGRAARNATEFAQQLADATGLEIELCDERLTTVEAARRLDDRGLKRRDQKKLIDGASAAVILQSWLDRR